MLVQFTVKNFLSFKETAVFDMSAIKSYREHSSNLIEILGVRENFLKVATIYGANASGKSNLFLALQTFQDIVIKSLNTNGKNADTALSEGYNPYIFLDDRSNTELSLIFIVDNAEYKYGFEYNANEIVSEWLYKKDLSTMRTVTVFEREGDETEFGNIVRRECRAFAGLIPKQALILTFLNKLNITTKIFNTVYSGIVDMFVVSSNLFENPEFLQKHLQSVLDRNKEELLSFLGLIDTGICDLDYTISDGKPDFFSYHSGYDGKRYPLKLLDESEGTLKSIAIFLNAKIAVSKGKSIFIDELNSRLHPLLLKYIIDIFNSPENKRGQLIYTTHDTTLLNRKFFRRDQIWFAQKDNIGRSKLIPLSDFKIRPGSSFEKDYLSGVYGGIPFLSDLEAGGVSNEE